ncbi:uncharacterized protein LOC110602850 isoform X2 [Manihot esculenta]|uniref:Uncharacterized protein n=1 Tax=Manihot esculenta TaxID=3983 RepID=A0ACB7I6S6_MANES|nr:uncharacterized protein LOC110602850 isoform X2 [Manihot esculenta]KAG8659568.1 hypothetical protein MANES_02G049900v8 [Manihot esculenta]
MASICHSLSFPSLSKPTSFLTPKSLTQVHFPRSISTARPCKTRPTDSPSSATTAGVQDDPKTNSLPMSVDNLHRFFDLNIGKWHGSFHQFDASGKLMQKVSTRLSVSSYGEDELISLIQTLYIKQPPTSTSISGYDEEPEWAEYKIKETNMFTVDKYQQIVFFPDERAFALRYQTAGMLETVLRQGVLGEDDTGEESPRNLKLPSRLPSIVCENCLYSQEKDRRARAFHIMDPKGVLEMLLIFLEDRGDGVLSHPSLDSITDITSTSDQRDVTTNVHWTGNIADNLITFDGGYQITLLPGGMYMGCPTDIAKSVAESKSFHLEFCWLEAPGKRQRLVRTYDVEGLAVSSTYFSETKL